MGDINLKVIFAIKISNKCQKSRFGKEKLVEDVITLECLPFNSSRRNRERSFGVVGKVLMIQI